MIDPNLFGATHLKSTIIVRQQVHSIITKPINVQIIAPFNRLQLFVAGTSDGYANTNSAELLNNCFINEMFKKNPR